MNKPRIVPINIQNETEKLRAVVLGIPDDFGGVPLLGNCFDPQSKFHVRNGSFPKQAAVTSEMNALLEILDKHNVKIYRPNNVVGLNQVFARDIGFVINDSFVVPNIIEERKEEVSALNLILDLLDNSKILNIPADCQVEGGDVIMHNNYVFIGVSDEEDFNRYQVARTNYAGFNFLKNTFSNYQFIAFELNKSDSDPSSNTLHLDCCFQPIGKNMAIVSPDGFKKRSDVDLLIDIFGKENILLINTKEMNNMYSNVFSISEKVIVSDKRFERLNHWLIDNGFEVEAIAYNEISKMGGLFRCSTLPLERR